MDRIAICIPTCNNDKVFMETINSILDVYQENWIILIGEQYPVEKWSNEKKFFYSTACAKAHEFDPKIDKMKVHYNTSKCFIEEELIDLADRLDIKYCLIMRDHIQFTKSMKRLNELPKHMNRYDLIGLEAKGLEPNEGTFQDDGSLKYITPKCKTCSPKKMVIWKCDIVRPFFIAKTKLLKDFAYKKFNVEFFISLNHQNKRVGYTDRVKGI